jgi:hypothetical protein
MTNVTPELLQVARHVVWHDSPEHILEYPTIFLAHLMTFGTQDDLAVARQYFSADDFRSVLKNPPPGIFTADAWIRWHHELFGADKMIPPMPERFPGSVDPLPQKNAV